MIPIALRSRWPNTVFLLLYRIARFLRQSFRQSVRRLRDMTSAAASNADGLGTVEAVASAAADSKQEECMQMAVVASLEAAPPPMSPPEPEFHFMDESVNR